MTKQPLEAESLAIVGTSASEIRIYAALFQGPPPLNEVEIWFGLIPTTVSASAKSNLSADIFALCRTVKM